MKKLFYLLGFSLLFSLAAQAQNDGISFQGLARNAAGEVLVSQKISLRLSILLGSESGAVAYTETRQTITNPQGIFAVVVGDNTTLTKSSNFSEINWGTASKFIKVEMDPNAGTNFTAMGTSKLQPVPFAFYAYGVDAENVDGILPLGSGGTGVASIAALKTSLSVDQINNTADASKPISTATQDALNTKVDKVSGKELSTNDYSTAEKTKLAAITGTNTGDQDLSTFATTTQLASKANSSDVAASLATKVDKEIGKGLSSNDYTTAEKTKLAAISGNVSGPQGIQGLPGATGATGPAGPQGLQGSAGPTGNDGAVGPQGATGPSGLPGAAGVAGPAGPRGLPGSTGAAGAQGQPGVAGPAGLLSSGTTAGNTPYWNGSQWVLNSSNLFNNGSNLGIGTATPTEKLDVVGNVKTSGMFTAGGKVIVGASTATSASAVLEVSSTTKGFLPPRMTKAQRDAISSPAQGLILYCTNCGADGEPQFFNGTSWVNLVGGAAAPLYIPTVLIGTQRWMDKNLDVVTYQNGDTIPQVTDRATWASLTTGAWCYYNNDPANDEVYGKLYNWHAVNDPRGLAPAGFHIPTSAEWSTLVTNLGGASVAGGKMKTTGTTNWNSPNIDATNQSGFKALPGGFRYYEGSFLELGQRALFWTATGIDNDAYYNYIYNNSGNTGGFREGKVDGFSVRVIKD
jgi:uncharacterized protein (TIGR02145 family)